ncbi:DNA-binding response OmpR family regulator [Clostridium tetanomorphum]|uniref:Stage 0 sporulation protein A homolog n=1 Tax=Clostridium tetanomorphum TaxID=1553 RepID=A0A923E9X0_CLOTT|nr:response regulator transcription factor [Clostridium tetanomorphum]KAJ52408.1 hypothetical protein CTM_07916 [Clostridium tetanomorphum DSM 665]MBC2397927.1 response regulator transcription factor [Clostridium tetanomorphum]MBP1864756.1 DNA-binding response OmpR family regulator [Clostridium tetanomorphum]NRS83932.1 DNA-binding response OmpR family regulator [Clostridium tetanomorphum]NRZ97151.1 DNA-binding response OmpR family regulator [Clostridium tetanomorphum]
MRETKCISILLVEDDISLIDGLEYSLTKARFNLHIVRTVAEALDSLSKSKFDLLILDITLPDGTGYDICKNVRRNSTVPIIFLTALDEEINVVKGLDIGGDDYITKPFKLNELISRIKALIRRSNAFQAKPTILESNNILVNLLENSAFKDGQEIEITSVEYRLLCYLMENENRILTRQQILDYLWDNNGDYIDDNTLSVYIRRLRMKIEKNPSNPKILLTVRRMGYKWKNENNEVK